ncbi:MAG: hypothetical protein WCK78_15155 [Paludibacter sp.]
MKTKILKLTIWTLLLLTIISCSTIRVSYYGRNNDKVQKIALVSTMIGKLEQGIFPLIDAAMFNPKIDKIADEIFDMEIRNVDKLRNRVAESLQSNFKVNVLYGDSLYKSSEYGELKKKFDLKRALDTGSERFPFIIIPKKEINPFMFEKGNVTSYFDEKGKNYTQTISEIASKLKADLVAVSYSYINTGAGSFGISGVAQAITYLYIFDKKGNLISSSTNFSKGTRIAGSDVNEFNDEIDNNLLPMIEPMMNKVLDKYIENKKQ